jgi:hypothetical protein
MATEEVEVMYFLPSYTSNLSYIYPIFSSKKILYSYIIFVKSGLTPCHCDRRITHLGDLDISFFLLNISSKFL